MAFAASAAGQRWEESGLSATLWCRGLISPYDLAEKTAQQDGEEHAAESVDHRAASFSMT